MLPDLVDEITRYDDDDDRGEAQRNIMQNTHCSRERNIFIKKNFHQIHTHECIFND